MSKKSRTRTTPVETPAPAPAEIQTGPVSAPGCGPLLSHPCLISFAPTHTGPWFPVVAGSPPVLFSAHKLAPSRSNSRQSKTGQTLGNFRGHAITKLLRWLGREGVKPAAAMRCVTALGFNPSPHTVSTQVQWGRTGKGTVPALDAETAAELLALCR